MAYNPEVKCRIQPFWVLNAGSFQLEFHTCASTVTIPLLDDPEMESMYRNIIEPSWEYWESQQDFILQ